MTKYIIAPLDAKDGDDAWFWEKYLTEEQEDKTIEESLVQDETENMASQGEGTPIPIVDKKP